MAIALRAFHFDCLTDYYLVNNAKYLIIANSTFSWWSAWLNDRVIETMAPKYWLRYNVSDGYWCVSDSVTSRFIYIDRKGRIFTYHECVKELNKIKEYNYNSEKDIQTRKELL